MSYGANVDNYKFRVTARCQFLASWALPSPVAVLSSSLSYFETDNASQGLPIILGSSIQYDVCPIVISATSTTLRD